MQRWAAIEPIISHLKSDYRMTRNCLKGFSVTTSINWWLLTGIWNNGCSPFLVLFPVSETASFPNYLREKIQIAWFCFYCPITFGSYRSKIAIDGVFQVRLAKTELVDHRRFKTRQQFIQENTKDIVIFYNRQRKQKKLCYLSPAQFTQHYYANSLVV